MIRNFIDRESRRVWEGEFSKSIPKEIQRTALRKLIQLGSAEVLSDMSVPPGNRLESLKGDMKGFYSIRINEKWRICFRWEDNGASDVGIINYH